MILLGPPPPDDDEPRAPVALWMFAGGLVALALLLILATR